MCCSDIAVTPVDGSSPIILSSSRSNSSMLAGIGVGIAVTILFVILAVALIIVYYKRRQSAAKDIREAEMHHFSNERATNMDSPDPYAIHNNTVPRQTEGNYTTVPSNLNNAKDLQYSALNAPYIDMQGDTSCASRGESPADLKAATIKSVSSQADGMHTPAGYSTLDEVLASKQRVALNTPLGPVDDATDVYVSPARNALPLPN